MKMKLLISAILLISISMLFMPGAKGQSRTYYLGDAIIYNGQVIIGSTNLGNGLEIFKLEADKLVRAAKINLFKAQYADADKFYDLAFSQEQEKLYVYLVDGRYLYKYDISDLSSPSLVSQIRDNAWDYFMGVDKQGDKILTFGLKGIKVWNLDGQIIDSYNLINQFAYNINFQPGDFILDMAADRLKFYDKNSRQFIREVPFSSGEVHNRKVMADRASGEIYLVDDEALKKYDYSGQLKNVFKHISNRGYDVDGLAGQDHLYFTDGKCVVKFAKSNLRPIKWAYTTDLGESNGWAMGLKVLKDGIGEKVVIFNNSTILLLDQDLKMISYAAADAADVQPSENLFLRLDKNRAAPNSAVLLNGGGYAAGEELAIIFASQSYLVKTDSDGRFTTIINVPSVLSVKTDIKVMGKSSGLSYSIGFEIE